MVAEEPWGTTRYNGTVTSFSPNTQWGFITCPELSEVYDNGIFFHSKDCGGGATRATFSKGQGVSFLLDEVSKLGKPQARDIRCTQDTPDPPGAVRYVGTVASFSAASAWGFIEGPDTTDVFFHAKDCSFATVSKGCKVSFLLDEGSGKPQARSVRVVQGGPEGGPDSGHYRGVVASYSSVTKWGFIQCPELASVYGNDVFFHNKDCGGVPVAKGVAVTFVLDDAADPSKPQARNVLVEAAAVASPKGRQGWVQSFPKQAAATAGGGGGGGLHAGWVQSFSEQAGWGFIQCPSLGLDSGKGIFFHKKDWVASGDPAEGTHVTFALGYGPSGKQQAVQVGDGGDQAQGGWLQSNTKRAAAAATAGPTWKKLRSFN